MEAPLWRLSPSTFNGLHYYCPQAGDVNSEVRELYYYYYCGCAQPTVLLIVEKILEYIILFVMYEVYIILDYRKIQSSNLSLCKQYKVVELYSAPEY